MECPTSEPVVAVSNAAQSVTPPVLVHVPAAWSDMAKLALLVAVAVLVPARVVELDVFEAVDAFGAL